MTTADASPASAPRLAIRGITKRFPGVVANEGVGFDVFPGEIHALLGENGAGKSTLVKMIYGLLRPDEGTIVWEGEPVQIVSPHEARRRGIGMVFQHFSLFEAMTVLENVALGLDGEGATRGLAGRIVEVSRAYGLPLDPERHVHSLSVGERQRIEIVRCLLQDPRLLIMDEPTSVLTPQEVTRLFATLRQLASEGCSILYISHKLNEIKALCDRATILRGGRVVAACDPKRETARSMAALMVGESLKAPERPPRRRTGRVLLQVEGLSLASPIPFGTDLRDVAFTVEAGEVFGVAGVAGNGQAELMATLAGETLTEPDRIRIEDRPAGHLDPRARRRLGLAYIPEERNGHAAVPDLSLADNALLSAIDRKSLAPGGIVREAGRDGFARNIVDTFKVKARGIGALASSLSGGNLQKFVVGREILQAPSVLIAAQPTWGVDAGAASAIHEALLGLAADGAAVLVLSQDLDELFLLADKIAVINAGRLSAPIPIAEADIGRIGLLMGGLHDLGEGTAADAA